MFWLSDRIGWLHVPTIRFILLFQGRSGSTHLIHHLESHSQIHARMEMLVEIDKEWDAQRKALDVLYSKKRSRRINAVGFKTKLLDVADERAMAEYIREHNLRVIHMFRSNPVRLAISVVRAARLRESHGDSNAYRQSQSVGRIEIPVDDFAQALHRSRDYDYLRDYVARIDVPTLDVEYESMVKNEAETLGRVFSFLDVRHEPTQTRTVKNTPQDLNLAVSNLGELRERFPDLESYFDAP